MQGKQQNPLARFFDFAGNKTNLRTEVVAGITTFVTMAYIIAVNPAILSQSGMHWGAVFLATIIASIIGTLVMGLFANVPYAQAPGMGLNAFFVFTVCFTLKFTWQQALSMVFLCGLINILITVTKVRKHIIHAIPKGLQHAISGGIGIFIAYIGLLNVGSSISAPACPPSLTLNQPAIWLFLIGLVLIIVLICAQGQGRHPDLHHRHRPHRHPHGRHQRRAATVSFSQALPAAPDLWRDLHGRGPAQPVY